MTLWDFLYITGCCFAWIMMLFEFNKLNEALPNEEKADFGFILLFAGLFSFLSWAVPLFWLSHKIYKRSLKK